jgi:hypothetical protein
MNLVELQEKIQFSPFKKQKYVIPISLVDLPDKIHFFNEIIGKDDVSIFAAHMVNLSTIKEFVAPFQRDVNTWSEDMQVKFVENIIMGCKTDIVLYTTIQKSTHEGCLILDGQHRVVALLKFIEGHIKAFGYTYLELLKVGIIAPRRVNEIYLNIVTFKNQNEAIKFYIDINENITHSPSDIIKAKELLIEDR